MSPLDSRGSPTKLETSISKLIQVLLQANAPSVGAREVKGRVPALMATAGWGISSLSGLVPEHLLEGCKSCPQTCRLTMSGIGAAQTSSRALYVNCSCITTRLHGTDQRVPRGQQ